MLVTLLIDGGRRKPDQAILIDKLNGKMSTRDCFSKALPNISLATRFDADGKEIQVNILKINFCLVDSEK